MANKIAPKISSPGSIKMPSGGRNPNVGARGSGLAPKPSGGANIAGNDKPSAPAQAGLARVSNVGNAPTAGSFLPVQKPKAGLANQQLGQPNPQTGAAATAKPKRRGIGASFYGEY